MFLVEMRLKKKKQINVQTPESPANAPKCQLAAILLFQPHPRANSLTSYVAVASLAVIKENVFVLWF